MRTTIVSLNPKIMVSMVSFIIPYITPGKAPSIGTTTLNPKP